MKKAFADEISFFGIGDDTLLPAGAPLIDSAERSTTGVIHRSAFAMPGFSATADYLPLDNRVLTPGESAADISGESAASLATISQLATYLISGYWQANGKIAHHWNSSTITYNLGNLNTAEQTLALSALNAWHEVANVTFVASSSANINFNHNGSMQAVTNAGWSIPGGVMNSATVDISADWITTDGGANDGATGIYSYGYQTYIHEIGHALGLGHQGPYNNSATYGVSNIYTNDTWQFSIMSYFAQSNFNGGSADYAITPQMADITAIQSIYGAATVRTGDTIYGFNSTAGSIYNFANYTTTHPLGQTSPSLTIYDSGGTDTLDLSGYSNTQTIDLTPGAFSSVGGMIHNLGIFTTTTIEKAIGGSGNDTIIGNSADNTITGGPGDDTIDGAGGTDSAVFAGLRSAYTLTDLGSGKVRVSGPDGTDTLTSIERLVFNDVTVPWPPTDVTAPSLVHEGSITLAIGATAIIPSSQLQFDDNVSAHAQEIYSIVTAPAHGTLLKSGSATSSFTQADIDNGLISYHENGSVFSSDSFVFKVTDAAGNQTTAQQFQFQILPPPDTTAPALTHDSTLTISAGTTAFITSSMLQFDDNASTHAQETYSIVTGSTHGTLLKSGVATTTFTQADIDNSLISFHENVTGAISDSFTFNVTDAAGNTSATTQFQMTVRPEITKDFNADGHSDVQLFSNSGTVGEWQLSGTQITSGGNAGTLDPAWHIAGTGDFNADARGDILLFRSSGTVGEWQLNGTQITGGGNIGTLDPTWHIAGTGDFNHDGRSDVLLNSNSGTVGEWQLNGTQISGGGNIGTLDPTWHIAGTGDFNHDGNSDVLLVNNNGTVGEWQLNGTQITGGGNIGTIDPTWHIAGTGDFNHDGNSDILLVNNNGTVGEWQLNGTQIVGGGNVGKFDSTWHIAATGDYNGDGNSDVLLLNNNGVVGEWQLNGTQIVGGGNIGAIDPTWHI